VNTPRPEMAKRWNNEWKDFVSEAIAEEKTVGQKLQEESPYKSSDNPNEPNNAVGWILEHNKKYLRSNRKLGIRSTRVKDFFDEDSNAILLSEAVGSHMVGGVEGFNDLNFAGTAGGGADFAPGSVFRPQARAAMVDGGKMRASLPVDGVVASVRDLADAQIPVYVPHEDAEALQNWRPRTPIPLDDLRVGESAVKAKWYATGIAIDPELRSSSAELLLLYGDKRRVRYERLVAETALLEIINASNASPIEVPGDGSSSIEIGSIFVDQDYNITTLVTNLNTAVRYVGFDRSNYNFNGGGQAPAGSAAGFDRLGNVVDRDVYITNRPSIGNNQLIGFDARDTIDLYIAPGSETSADEFIQRTRSYELTYTIKWVVALRHPTEVIRDSTERPIRRFSLAS